VTENLCRYAVLQFAPSSQRGESVNIGVAVFLGDDVQLHLTPRLEKARAIAPGLDVSSIVELCEDVPDLLLGAVDAEDKLRVLQQLGPITATSFGTILDPGDDYQLLVDRLIKDYVESPTFSATTIAPIRTALREQLSQLFSARARVSSEPRDIDRHLVVSRFPVAASERLFSDFAYRNGTYRFVQILDLRGPESSLERRFQESCKKALALDKARRIYGSDARRYSVIANASSENRYSSAAVEVLRDYSDDLFEATDGARIDELCEKFLPMGQM
jgi:hypothetical protein